MKINPTAQTRHLSSQVKSTVRTPSKMRTLVTSTNDRNMFISGHAHAVARPVSSSKAAQVRRSGVSSDDKKKPSKHAVVTVRTSLPYVDGDDQNCEPTASKPSAHQQQASRRDWAVMSAFEKQVFQKEKQHQLAERLEIVAEQRREMEAAKKNAEAVLAEKRQEKAKLARAVAADVASHKAEEVAKADAKKQAALATKLVRDEMFAEARTKKENEVAAKRLAEFKLVAAAERELELEKAKKAQKLLMAKNQFRETMALNEKLNSEKAERKKVERLEDSAVAEAYQKKLELEERKRNDVLSAFHEKIAARAGKAGESVVANAEAAAMAEVLRSRKFEDERERALAEKERREFQSRAAANERTRHMLQRQLDEKADAKRAAREEDARYAGEVLARVESAARDDLEAKQERRRRAIETRLHQEAQAEQKRNAKLHNHFDVMDPAERLLNSAILNQAEAVVLRGEAFD